MVDIAIVGIGCRFPGGVRKPSDLWTLLTTKGDGMVDIPADRWDVERFYDPDPEVPGRMYTRKAGFLSDPLTEFDPEFFGISPREAAIMDPQQRLMLEVAQEALDDAGQAGRVAGQPVGVYVGGFTADNMAARHSEPARHAISMHTPTSSTYTMLSNRISFVFDLRGPSMTIDTACSSSLVALHEAVSALQRGEIEMALVGGVNAMIRPETFISMCKGHFLAPDGRCKTFDKSADGYARGEGAGVVVLRPLEQALAHGDRIYAVIRATGSNQDGRTSGITVPNEQAQSELIREVTARARLSPADIGYVEAHGTGTAVGDPIEMAAIGRMLGAVEGRQEALRVGSIKASIGHTEAAAGVASVIKAALTLHHRTIAPQAWLQELNPAIPFDAYRLQVPLEVEPFPAAYGLPAAAVNGFGYGGSNAHAVLVAAPTPAPVAAPAQRRAAQARVCPVSGRNDPGARAFAADLARALETLPESVSVDHWVDALWTRRMHQPSRLAAPYLDRQDLLEQLQALAEGGGKASVRALPQGRRLVFVLSGMGPQWWGMARDLLDAGGTFARVAEEIDAVFKPMAGWSLVQALGQEEADSRVTQTAVAQPTNFLVQVALAEELAHWGVRPSAIVGHSVGEVSAAYLSGMLTLKDALTVSYHRARLQARQAGLGSMLAVGLSEAEALRRIIDCQGVEIAAVNGPQAVTLAGHSGSLQDLAAQLGQEGVFQRLLQVEVPYHSHLMDPILDELRDALSGLQPRPPRVPLYSTVTGQQVQGSGSLWDADYWLANVRQPVRFAQAISALIQDGYRCFAEVGPHSVLAGNVRQVLQSQGETGACVHTLARQQDDMARLRTALAELYTLGALDEREPPGGLLGPVLQADLPCHRFQRVPLWTEVEDLRRDRLGDPDLPVLPGFRTSASQAEWECELSVGALPWLKDHVVAGAVLLPGAAYLDAALAAAVAVTGRAQPALENVEFIAPLVIGEHEAPMLRLCVHEETRRFTVRSRPADGKDWTLHARGRLISTRTGPSIDTPEHPQPPPAGPARRIEGPQLYERLAAAGLKYGPHFQRIRHVEVHADTLVATLDGLTAPSRHQAHPAVLDCALQCMAAWAALAVDEGRAELADESPMVPAGLQGIRQFGPIPDRVQVKVIRRTPQAAEPDLVADIALQDSEGRPVLEMRRVQFRPLTPRPSVLGELEAFWYEAVTTPWTEGPLPAPGPDHPEPTLFIVGLGPHTRPLVAALEGTAPTHRSMIVQGSDPAALTEALVPRLRSMLAESDSAPTLVLCAAGQENADRGSADTGGADPAAHEIDQAVCGVAALAGLSLAVQEVLARLEEERGSAPAVRGLVLTREAVGLPGGRPPHLAQAALVGARRVLRNEDSTRHWCWLDVDAHTRPEEIGHWIARLAHSQPEVDELLLRNGQALVPQWQRTLPGRRAELDQARTESNPERNFAIELPASRLLTDLSLREVPRRAPGEDEIELRLEALELNYKDAMKVVGLLGMRELSGTYFGLDIGMSGVGVVCRVGPAVTRFSPGDTVVFGSRGMARRYLTTRLDEGFFIRVPADEHPVDLAAMVPWLTAQYCVFHAAQVQPGEVVLVHGGAGGVGAAAIQAARAAGARVFATASTAQRREIAAGLGAEAVFDSRSIDFVDEVRRLTGGRGADVVINSAPADIITANLDVAAEFGRVIEVGKLDIFTDRPLPLRPFEKNLSFVSVDIDRMCAFRPALVQQLQNDIVEGFRQGRYRTLPNHLMPLSRMPEAFEMVQRSAHIGRVMLDFSDPAVQIRPAPAHTPIHGDGCYLITGGWGAFGLSTAHWLVSKGARHLVLVSRSGPVSAAQHAAAAAWAAQGVKVHDETVDVADAQAVQALIERIRQQLPPLRGIFHTAGVALDGPIINLSEQALRTVLAPKALGALHLHQALERSGTAVDLFVLYSSITAVTGTVPQTSYAAANAMLDGLAALRRAKGLPATSVNWGALSGGGMAESSEEVARYLGLLGYGTLGMGRACEYLDAVLALGATQVVVGRIDWPTWARAFPASSTVRRFADLVQTAGAGQSASRELHARLQALPAEERVAALTALLREHIAAVMGIPAESVDSQTPLPELGLDSLMGVELNLRINTALGVEISALEFTRSGGLAALAARLLQRMGLAEKEGGGHAPAAPPTGQVRPAAH
ncbi:MAG: SDR family NAD(P)-dependent oxidoreductase [Curvibacter sp.]|nr:SDR family NAD(P)-dependent oxidoreductase [Curvibacter sp.]